MLNDTDIGGLDKFLASSGKGALPRVQEHDNILVAGATLGSWRVEAFLGRGGSGEVYRVVHSVTRTPAAAKVLTRDDEVTKKRVHDEIDFLAQNQLPQFPRYFESGECNVFVRPMQLKPNHEYWVIGPGILDASVTSAGTNTTMRLKNCVFLNRSSVPFRNTGIRYVFQGGAYLNFTNMDRPEDFSTLQLEGYDGAFDEIRFKGPETIKGLNELRNKESWERLKKDTSNHYFGPDKNFFRFLRHILYSKHEYIMESMEKQDTKAELGDESFDFHLDPNRIRTDAEIQLFADVFSISREEARRIITEAGFRCAT